MKMNFKKTTALTAMLMVASIGFAGEMLPIADAQILPSDDETAHKTFGASPSWTIQQVHWPFDSNCHIDTGYDCDVKY